MSSVYRNIWWIQNLAREQFNMFHSVSRLFLRWSGFWPTVRCQTVRLTNRPWSTILWPTVLDQPYFDQTSVYQCRKPQNTMGGVKDLANICKLVLFVSLFQMFADIFYEWCPSINYVLIFSLYDSCHSIL